MKTRRAKYIPSWRERRRLRAVVNHLNRIQKSDGRMALPTAREYDRWYDVSLPFRFILKWQRHRRSQPDSFSVRSMLDEVTDADLEIEMLHRGFVVAHRKMGHQRGDPLS